MWRHSSSPRSNGIFGVQKQVFPRHVNESLAFVGDPHVFTVNECKMLDIDTLDMSKSTVQVCFDIFAIRASITFLYPRTCFYQFSSIFYSVEHTQPPTSLTRASPNLQWVLGHWTGSVHAGNVVLGGNRCPSGDDCFAPTCCGWCTKAYHKTLTKRRCGAVPAVPAGSWLPGDHGYGTRLMKSYEVI